MAKKLRSRKLRLWDESSGGDESSDGDESSSGDESSDGNDAASSVTWSILPYLLLRRIFSFLNQQNGYKMAVVCKRWNTGLRIAGVWGSFVFNINRDHLSIDEIRFATKYGDLFRQLLIHSDATVVGGSSTRGLERLLNLMGILALKSKLITIGFNDLSMHLNEHTPDRTYEKICDAIADFLGSQTTLKTLDFTSSSFEYTDGIEILRRGIASNRGIAHLELTKFLKDKEIDPDNPADERILSEILSLPDLRKLVIDYRLILGENANSSQVVELLEYHPKPLDITIHLTINQYTESFMRLTSDQWRTLKTSNPNIRRKLGVHVSALRQFWHEMEEFIVPDTPITRIDYSFDFQYEYDLTNFLDFLVDRKIYKYLKDMDLQYFDEIDDLDSVFSDFLRLCSELEYFRLFMFYSVTGLETLLDYLLEFKPESLKKFRLYSSLVPKRQLQTLMDPCLQYIPVLESVGIDLKIGVRD